MTKYQSIYEDTTEPVYSIQRCDKKNHTINISPNNYKNEDINIELLHTFTECSKRVRYKNMRFNIDLKNNRVTQYGTPSKFSTDIFKSFTPNKLFQPIIDEQVKEFKWNSFKLGLMDGVVILPAILLSVTLCFPPPIDVLHLVLAIMTMSMAVESRPRCNKFYYTRPIGFLLLMFMLIMVLCALIDDKESNNFE